MNKAVFLDRDGVINEVLSERVKFVNKPSDFYLLPGVGEAIRIINELNYLTFVVTNQGGIGLGFMSEKELSDVHIEMKRQLNELDAIINDSVYCPHKPNAGCICRKPNPDMIIQLAKKHRVDLTESYMVGDRKPDIEAGRNAGVRTVLVGDRSEKIKADIICTDLLEFANKLT